MELLIEFMNKLIELRDYERKLLQAGHGQLGHELKMQTHELVKLTNQSIGEQHLLDLKDGE